MKRATFEQLPDWLSAAEVCSYLHLSRNTVYELIRSGEIASRKFGRVVRIPKNSLQPMPRTDGLETHSHA